MENNTNAFDIANLIIRHKNKELTEQEEEQLQAWANANARNRALYHSLLHEEKNIQDEMEFLSGVNVQAAWQRVAEATGHPVKSEEDVIPLWKRFSTWRNVAAILVMVVMAVTVYQLKYNKAGTNSQPELAVNTVLQEQPAEAGPVLILQDGSTISLDSLHTGTLSELNGVKMISEDGILRIDASDLTTPDNALIANNTIATPRGVRYQVVLPDGSKVWLNAASSLKFPAAFTGNERRVELTGEAFFEVVKSRKQFIVQTGELDVTVLGTSFNVSAYAEDKDIATTLVTGHVRLSGGQVNGVTNLTPGKRALFSKASKNMVVSEVDTETYIVWKEGKLYFESEELETIITKLGRWYAIEPVYLDKNSRHKTFTGVAYTDQPIQELLNMISQTTDVAFERKGQKLLIKKK